MANINDKFEAVVKIDSIAPIKEFKNDFRVQTAIVTETKESFPQTYKVTFQNDKIEKLKNFKPGDLVILELFIKGRKVTNQTD